MSSMSKVVVDALNQQITNELGASYEYLAMSAWCEGQTLQGAAKWLRLQSQEEYGHAIKLFDFVLARGGQVELKALPAPGQSYKSLHDVFDKVLKQEQQVSQQIDALYDLAFKEKSYAGHGRAAVVPHRAGRGREVVARDPGQAEARRQRRAVGAGSRPRARRAVIRGVAQCRADLKVAHSRALQPESQRRA